jgi:hypothetical protein
MWVQPALFPEFPLVFYAYEMDAYGRWWEVYDDCGTMVASIEPEDFGDFLDFSRSINYDVKVFTYESWEAMDEYSSV